MFFKTIKRFFIGILLAPLVFGFFLFLGGAMWSTMDSMLCATIQSASGASPFSTSINEKIIGRVVTKMISSADQITFSWGADEGEVPVTIIFGRDEEYEKLTKEYKSYSKDFDKHKP
ncbi:MAG: hypothetical protein C4589_10610 [Peptococcaceae bacterium]|nr:MAG: hypothetical protein C4589_10610 [Peptococcaceae bacterium]